MAKLAALHGPRASIQFLDGRVETMPSEPLRRLGIPEGGRFTLVVEYRGRNIVNVRVEPLVEARPAIGQRPLPKVMVRAGMKTTTRR